MGWSISKMSEVTNIISGGTPKSGISDYWFGDVKWITPKDMGKITGIYVSETGRNITRLGLEKSSAKLIPESSVILSTRAPIGHLAINKVPMATNQGCRGLVPKSTLDTKFLYYFLLKSVSLLNDLGSGTTFKELSKTALEKLEIPHPEITEQKRIVAILDQAFADIEQARAKTEQNLKNARELFESYLQQVFSQRGDEVSLSEITESISDGDHSAPPKSEEGIPFITISNINKLTNEIDFSNTFKVPESYYSSLKATRKPTVGDILYTVTGSYGIPVIVRDKKEFCFQRHIGLVRPNKNTNSNWLYYLLMSPQVFKQADEGATGTAQKTVSLKLLRSIKVPNIPLDKQISAVKDLDNIYQKSKKLEYIYTTKLVVIDELKKSILQKAFSGELTKALEVDKNKGAVA